MVYSKIKKCFEYLNILFKVPRSYILRHVNDDSDVISRAESERRIFWLFFMLGFALNLVGCLLIFLFMILKAGPAKYEFIETESGKDIFNSALPVIQKLVLILGDGTSLFLYMNQNLHLKISKSHKLDYDPHGFFAYHQNDRIQTLIGSKGKPNSIYDSNFNSNKIFGSDLPSAFGGDLTGARFGHWVWFIGGEKAAFIGDGDMWTRITESYLWSISKKKWTLLTG